MPRREPKPGKSRARYQGLSAADTKKMKEYDEKMLMHIRAANTAHTRDRVLFPTLTAAMHRYQAKQVAKKANKITRSRSK